MSLSKGFCLALCPFFIQILRKSRGTPSQKGFQLAIASRVAGTYINDERIVKGEVAEVHPGDVIALTKPHPPGA